MVGVIENAVTKARKIFIDEIKKYVKDHSGKIEINKSANLHRFMPNPEGEDLLMDYPYYIKCIRIDIDGEVVVDYLMTECEDDIEETYTDMLDSLSFDEIYNICEKI